MRQELQHKSGDEAQQTVFGWCFGVTGFVIGAVVATVQGVYNVATGGNFDHGLGKTIYACTEAAVKFGNKHNDTIVQGALGALAGLAATTVAKKTFRIK